MVFYDAVTIELDGETTEHPPGSMMIWDPKQEHHYGNPDKSWLHSWTHCHGRSIAKHLRDSRLPVNRPFVLPDPWLVDRYLRDIHRELNDQQRPDPIIVSNLFQNWIREMARALEDRARNREIPKEFLQLKSHIEESYDHELDLTQLAKRIGYSVPHLCSRFKKHFGATVIGYAIQLRLEHARYLLNQDRGMSVTDVARRVGYDDIYYFSKLFKNRYGVSPRQSRGMKK
jgi:AraC-like DNA-binding protein